MAQGKVLDGGTALHMAATLGDAKSIVALVAEGAPLEAQEKRGLTPLHTAAMQGHVEAIGALVDAGAVLEAQTKEGQTPLDLAAMFGHTKAIVALAASGATMKTQVPRTGSLPLHTASLRTGSTTSRARRPGL